MNRRKKLISILISLTMALGVTALPAFAETDEANNSTQPTIEAAPPADESSSEEPAAVGETDGDTSDDPQPPVLKVSVNGPGLLASWNKVEGYEYYCLYRSYEAGNKGSLISKSTNLYYHDKSTPSGKQAYYTLYACANNKESLCSSTVSSKIFRVYIETGHGINSARKWDSGCRWKKYQEAKLMIPICQSMTKHLERNGIYAYTDAFNGNKTNLKWTLNWLNKNNKKGQISAFINVHCDYYKAKSGTLALYKTSSQKRLATCLNNGVRSKVKIRNRGLKKRRDLLTLNSSKPHCVSVLYECGSIKRDNYNLRANYDAYGQGLAKGLCTYLGVSYR